MNATAPVMKHIATKTLESKRTLLSMDDTKVSPNMLSMTPCTLITHTTRNGRTELAVYNTKIIQRTSKASRAILVLSQICLKL